MGDHTPGKCLEIRPYQADDREAVISLWRNCGLIVPDNDPDRDIECKLQVKPEWFLVGYLDTILIATCMAGYDGHRGWINYLAVAPEHQGAGFGADLLARAEQLLAAVGCAKINVQLRKTNDRAHGFYRRLGYRQDAVISLGKRLNHDS